MLKKGEKKKERKKKRRKEKNVNGGTLDKEDRKFITTQIKECRHVHL